MASGGAMYFKIGIAFTGGICLGLLVISSWNSVPQATSVAEPTNLLGMPAPSSLTKTANLVQPMSLHNLPGASPWKELALAGIEKSNRCHRDVSMNANVLKAATETTVSKARDVVARAEAAITSNGQKMLQAGQGPPFGFFDPIGLSAGISEGRLLFLREAEIKHGRVCMMAVVGIIVGENFHPLLGGYDGPAVDLFPFQKVPLGDFWPIAFLQTFVMLGWEEYRTGYPHLEGKAFEGLIDNKSPEVFAAKTGRIPGDLGFDPLGLKPKKADDLLTMQNKELNNGRLAMLATLGILVQEATFGEKIFR